MNQKIDDIEIGEFRKEKPTVRIENWEEQCLFGFSILKGNVYGHPKCPDGQLVWTSKIVSEDFPYSVETENTIYVLGNQGDYRKD